MRKPGMPILTARSTRDIAPIKKQPALLYRDWFEDLFLNSYLTRLSFPTLVTWRTTSTSRSRLTTSVIEVSKKSSFIKLSIRFPNYTHRSARECTRAWQEGSQRETGIRRLIISFWRFSFWKKYWWPVSNICQFHILLGGPYWYCQWRCHNGRL